MDCHTAESMVTRYINGTLNVHELEVFLEHIQTCSSCYDELETYYIVHNAMQQLDKDQDENVFDFKELLEQDLRRARRYVNKKKIFWILMTLLGILSIGILLCLVVFVLLEAGGFL